MKKLIAYLLELGCVEASKVTGPNGAFISAKKENGEIVTLPVGKKSQAGTIEEMNVLFADDGQAIATVNHYETNETVSLVAA